MRLIEKGSRFLLIVLAVLVAVYIPYFTHPPKAEHPVKQEPEVMAETISSDQNQAEQPEAADNNQSVQQKTLVYAPIVK